MNLYLRSVRDDLTSMYDGTTKWPKRGWMPPCPDWDPDPTIACGHGYHLCGEDDDPTLVSGPVWQAVRAENVVASPYGTKHRAERVYVLKTGTPKEVHDYLCSKGWKNPRLHIGKSGIVVNSGEVALYCTDVTVNSGGFAQYCTNVTVNADGKALACTKVTVRSHGTAVWCTEVVVEWNGITGNCTYVPTKGADPLA